jgi:Flp pilus assembly protein TadG
MDTRRLSARGARGFVLILTAVSAIVLLGVLGLTVDLGRMYITKSEAQAFADSAALAAALELDGTASGITDANTAVAANLNHWNFSTQAFTGTITEFATALAGPWVTAPAPATNVRFARVTATASVKLFFLPAVVGTNSATVRARAVGAQTPKTSFREALFPFSPYAHNTVAPSFGLVKGTDYTLRWPSNPKLGNGSNVCTGDRTSGTMALAEAAGGSERGYIEDTSASLIRSTIMDDYQSITRVVGDLVHMTGGAKQSQLTSLEARILQDSDSSSQTYAQYVANAQGNSRRIVAVPINDGGTPAGSNNRIVGIGAFFLMTTGQYGNGGNQCWCAEYIGIWVQGSRKSGAGDGTNGAFVVRLAQ